MFYDRGIHKALRECRGGARGLGMREKVMVVLKLGEPTVLRETEPGVEKDARKETESLKSWCEEEHDSFGKLSVGLALTGCHQRES